jgi:hypothetical protein
MFQLTKEEAENLRLQFATSSLRSQFVISGSGYGGRRYLPCVFTEQGVAMLSTVLNSKRAIAVNIAIMRTFVRLRQILATHKDLAERLTAIEKKYDKRFRVVFDILSSLWSRYRSRRSALSDSQALARNERQRPFTRSH